MKKCPFCGEKVQDEAKKCKYCMERLESKEWKSHSSRSNRASIIWRILKIIYFVITCLIVIIILIAIANNTVYDGTHTRIIDYYFIVRNILLVILGYALLTDLFKRIKTYISEGMFRGFLDYKKIIKKNVYYILAFIVVILGLTWLSNHFYDRCTGIGEMFDDYGTCICANGYLRVGDTCSETIGKDITNKLPIGGKLREVKEVPNKPGVYIGIYVENDKLDDVDSSYYDTCPGEVEGQAVEGDYHIFTYEGGKITSDMPIPMDEFIKYGYNSKLRLAFKNTKSNNYNFFGGEKPIDELDGLSIGITSLINFKDYNGDGIKHEFLLISYIDGVCGHNSYLVAGFNDTTKKAMVYGIKDNNGIHYRGDNFIPNEKGIVNNGRSCGDHGSETESKNIYKFDKNIYVLTSSKETQCDGFDSYQSALNGQQTILQDVNLRETASSQGNLIQKISQTNVVNILSSTTNNGALWYYIDFNGIKGWISSVAFTYKN